MKISIQPSALADLRVGFRFYEKQQKDLGSYFLDSLYTDIDSLMLYAGIHSRHFGKYRLLSDKFPYAVYYDLRDDLIMVRAVLDLRRDPSWISRKLQKLKFDYVDELLPPSEKEKKGKMLRENRLSAPIRNDPLDYNP